MSNEHGVTAIIDNARFLDVDGKRIVAGNVRGDIHKRFADGEVICTSEVLSVEGDIVVTKNSRYLAVMPSHFKTENKA